MSNFCESKNITFHKIGQHDFGGPQSVQTRLFEAPGDFSMFSKTVDLGPKRHSKNDPLDPQKTHSKIDTQNPKALKCLYTKRLSASECHRKSNSENSDWPKSFKNHDFQKRPKVRFRDAPDGSRSGPTFFSVSATFGPSGRPDRGPKSDRLRRTRGPTESLECKILF